MKKVFEKNRILLAVALFLLFPLFFVSAASNAPRSYKYDSISVEIRINKDTTFDVTEDQAYNYTGEYHQGWRSIPFNKIDSVSDISVIDGETGRALAHSFSRLDKLSSSSWGRFTYYKENGAQNIEWYYDLADTSHKWILKYKVHGGLGFYNDHDELYWNIFTDYDVPVASSEVIVFLPEKVSTKDLKISASVSTDNVSRAIQEDGSFYYSSKNFAPKGKFTIFAGWPKGVVDQSAYWRDIVAGYIGYILAVLIALGSGIFTIIYWYLTEVYKKGRGVIVPQYEPPEKLKPAMAEVILTERISNKSFVATFIDLAVRGYVRIVEEKPNFGNYATGMAAIAIVLIFIFIIGVGIAGGGAYSLWVSLPIIAFSVLMIKMRMGGDAFKALIPKDYTIELVKDFQSADELKGYEKLFLQNILNGGSKFSTREFKKKSSLEKADLTKQLEKVKDKILEETEIDTAAFEIGPIKEKKKNAIVAGVLVAGFLLLQFGGFVAAYINQWSVLGVVSAVCALLVFAFVKFEARLSARGHLLKEEWLGFKMFLEYFGRYRWKNVTPDMFEKYLSYAIIFGVEKKWSKAFEQMNLTQPSWYISAGVYGGFGLQNVAGQGISSFSASAFSASLSSSFSSAFSSSAGGGGGGGGGAGGGGGGGGGGAS